MKALLPLLLVLATSSCASTSPQKAPICDGKYRRPANPYGSVLPVVPLDAQFGGLAVVSSPPAPSAAPASVSHTSPTQRSSAPSAKPDPKSLRSCGGKS